MRLYLVTLGSLALSLYAYAGPDEDLYHGSKSGDYAACKVALAHGANANYVHRRTGLTPLWNAVIGNHEGIVRLLLDAGADAQIPVTRVLLVDQTSDSHENEEEKQTSSVRPRSQSVPGSALPGMQRRISVSSIKTEESPRNGSPRTPRRMTLRLETLLRVSPRKKEKDAETPTSLPELPICNEAPSHNTVAIAETNSTSPSIATTITSSSPGTLTPRSPASSPRTPRQVIEFMRLPIHEAVERGYLNIVRLLLPHHRDDVVLERDNTGMTLGDIALRSGQFTIYGLLRDHSNRAQREHIRLILIPLHQAVRDNDFNLVEYIVLHSNQRIDTLDSRARSPLEVALSLGYHQIAALLVIHGAQMPEGFVDLIPRYVFLLSDLLQLYPRLAEGLIREMRRDNIADKDVSRWLLSHLEGEEI